MWSVWQLVNVEKQVLNHLALYKVSDDIGVNTEAKLLLAWAAKKL